MSSGYVFDISGCHDSRESSDSMSCSSSLTMSFDRSESGNYCQSFFNLSDGNPEILIENIPAELRQHTFNIKDCGYQEPQGTLDGLILDTHRCYHPRLPLSTHNSVTVGHGSTQIIYNAILALKEILGRRVVIWYQKPHYPYMYELLNNDSNCILRDNEFTKDGVDVEIVTTPNNPTGEERSFETLAKYHIIDCAYSWPQYTDSDMNLLPIYTENMYVFSFSKLSGLGGLRVGWSLSHPGPWADALRNRIYLTHMSSIVPSINVVKMFLNYILINPEITRGLWYSLRKKMEELRSYLSRLLPVTNSSGPYCWVKMKKNELERQYNIIGKDGTDFGEPNYTRLSLMGSESNKISLIPYIDRLLDGM